MRVIVVLSNRAVTLHASVVPTPMGDRKAVRVNPVLGAMVGVESGAKGVRVRLEKGTINFMSADYGVAPFGIGGFGEGILGCLPPTDVEMK